ncbi:small integral membrane protein 24 [Rhynochetos jubatus]
MPSALQSLSLLLILTATAWGQAGTGPKELQPWLIALTAVVIFLSIVFVLLLISRLWQTRKLGDPHKAAGTDRYRSLGVAGLAPGSPSRGLGSPGDGCVLAVPFVPRRLEHGGCANAAAEDSDSESGGEEQSKATSL